MFRTGDKIGPYILVSKLGRGTFGVVWLAEKRTALAVTKVALKLPNDDDIDIEAIKREASVWVEASGHPNILPIIDADIYDEQVVIVSEYAPDGSLADWLKRHRGRAPTHEAAVEMTSSILDGLAHLHERRIIHRDLKPANILLQGKTPRLVDFGLARVLKSTSQSSNVSGTYAYMPPEAFDGKCSEQTDVWSAGVILYQLLTGHLPYPQTDTAALIGALLTREPEPPPDALPPALREVITHSLQKNLAERYQSVVEMREALLTASKSIAPHPSAPVVQATTERELSTRKFIAPPVEPFVASPPPTTPSPIMKMDAPYPQPSEYGTPWPQKSITSIPIIEDASSAVALGVQVKRHGKLWLGIGVAVVVIIGLVIAVSMGLFSSKESSAGNQPMPLLKSFSFETVKLDAKGNVTDRRTGQAKSYTEDLGNGVTLEMVEIPAGTFTMGSPNTEKLRSSSEGPQHQVTVQKFYMSKFEVTQAQWRAVASLPKINQDLNADPSNFKGANKPVEMMTWDDAVEFCNRLSRKTGREYRLPSEAEWEYAARAGTQTPFAFGETITPELVNYDGDYPYGGAPKGIDRGKTIAVESLDVANGFGLFDMHGNVWEWCLDYGHENYNGAPADGSAWLSGGDSNKRVLRSGAWYDNSYYCRSAVRGRHAPDGRDSGVGLRIVAVARSS